MSIEGTKERGKTASKCPTCGAPMHEDSQAASRFTTVYRCGACNFTRKIETDVNHFRGGRHAAPIAGAGQETNDKQEQQEGRE